MKNIPEKKEVSSISIIGKDDKPTSVFIVGKSSTKRTFRQNLHQFLYEIRKKRIIKSLKANPHSMEQVADYLMTELGFSEVDKTKEDYKTDYVQMRASFLMQYKPELLGDLAKAPCPNDLNEENIALIMAEIKQRQQAAADIPPELFDIDLHIYEKNDKTMQAKIIIETTYGYIGGSASGLKNRSMKKFDKTFRKIYQYYGVTLEDIEHHSKRYTELVKTLTRR